MSSGHLLLIAGDNDLRRSLAFALEAEGFAVTLRDAPPPRQWLAAHRFDCTIVEQKALQGETGEAIAFCLEARPVVLVAERPHGWLAGLVSETLELPLRPDAVTTAVWRATHGGTAPAASGATK